MSTIADCRELLAPRCAPLDRRRFDSDAFWQAIAPALDQGFRVADVGRSVLGRPLRTLTWGTGPERVMMWSQMHGDESTATMALADLVSFLSREAASGQGTELADGLTICLFPVVNPDGATVWQRENANGIDINRDARAGLSPEARALRDQVAAFSPAYGFNLHDQDVRRRAGREGNQVAFAFLAPAADPEGTWTPTRSRARGLAAFMAGLARQEHPGAVARWTDEYEPRAFGEHCQTAGAATVLVETGAVAGDTEKQRLAGDLGGLLIATLRAIATGSWEAAPLDQYDALPLNHSVDHDLQLVGATVSFDGREMTADVGLLFDDPVARTGPRVAELGDLGEATWLDRRDCRDHWVVIRRKTGDRDQFVLAPELPVSVELRRGSPDGPVTESW